MAKTLPTTKPASAAAPAAALPAQIEIFRAGRHTDDLGTVHNFSQADVAGMVSAYDPALREAPLTVGHPKDNLPAYGWVKGLALNAAGNLAMDTHQVAPQFAEMVGNKLFKKRSASFYPPGHASNPKPGNWYLRHVAFLGAQPPAIAGLADFSDSHAEGAVNFSEGDEPAIIATPETVLTTPATQPLINLEQLRMTQELKDQLDAAHLKHAESNTALVAALAETATAKAQLAQFAETAKRDRTAGFVSFADVQIKAGVLLPKDKEAAVAVLGTLADAQPVSFAEGGATKTVAPADWLKTFISTRAPVVSFGEHAAGTLPGAGQGTAGMTEAEIDAKAHAYARQHKVSYAEAASAVCSFTS